MHTTIDQTATRFASRAASAAPRHWPNSFGALREYFASDSTRTLQTVLGLIWLLDGGLQFQKFMYSSSFPAMLKAMQPGQPHWLFSSLGWGANLSAGNLGFWDTLYGLTQICIGLGILYRPTVKLALAGSFAWVFIVWWFGEAFGMLFANTASPLTGAPGAVLLYALIGLLVWPNGRRGGLLGERGARISWAILWVAMGWLWLIAANTSANAIHDAISNAPSNMGWLTSLLTHAANLTAGNGFLIALVLAAVSIAIGVTVGLNWNAKTFLWLAIYLNIVYWIIGQGFGGITTGGGTDPNAGPLFIVLAWTLYTILPDRQAQQVEAQALAHNRFAGAVS